MGWCRKGADMLSHIRIYWKSGSNMLEVVQTQEKIKMEEKAEGENYFSASEMLSWENRHRKTNGKYIEALCASIANCQMSAKVNFNTSILVYFKKLYILVLLA